NSFARQQMFEFDSSASKKEKEDVYHFIGYIPFRGRLIELDGLKDGPYDLGPIQEGQDWVEVARPIIEKRMQKYATGEIHFNLMAVISDRKMLYEREVQQLRAVDTDEAKSRIRQLEMMIEDENAKMQQYKVSRCKASASGTNPLISI